MCALSVGLCVSWDGIKKSCIPIALRQLGEECEIGVIQAVNGSVIHSSSISRI